MVRDADPDRYISALYAPEGKRRALLALAAFNAETAAVRDRVSEPMPGEIRLQWWRDAIDGPSGAEAIGHPVLSELHRAVETFGLPKDAFIRYLGARVFDLYDDPMPSRADLEGYAGETDSALIQLAALVLDPAAAPAFSDAAGHAGCAQTTVTVLRLADRHRARGQCFVPGDLLAAAGSSREAWLSGDNTPANGIVRTAMIALARQHHDSFAARAGAMPASLRPAFLPLVLTPAYLKGFEATRGSSAELSALGRHWRLFRAAMRGW
jgi:phytoene synthase